MGKPRRPRGESLAAGRSTWEPNPALDPDPPAHAVPPAEVAASEPVEMNESASVERAPEATPSAPAEDEVVETRSAIPLPVAEPAIAEPETPDARPATVAPASGSRIAFTPERLDLAGIGATVAGYVRGEGEAVAAHIRALSETRSPADAIRLQVGEIQRAADASLRCWSTVARKVGRIFALR